MSDDEHPTVLRSMAIENHWKTYSIPYGVGGRFSVFTEVGFVTAALVGFDIEVSWQVQLQWMRPVKKRIFLKILLY